MSQQSKDEKTKAMKAAVTVGAVAVAVGGLLWAWRHKRADPYMWLEEVLGDKCLGWVKQQNANALSRFGEPAKQALYTKLLAIYDSKDKIPYVSKINGEYYNFWKDEGNIRGVWRKTSLDEYKKASPAWTVVLDLDALGKLEGESWVWKGHSMLDEGPGVRRSRTMLSLSRGGADATVKREFDLVAMEFVKDGFVLPEAKSRVSWKSKDVLWVGTDFGPGSLTDSGYPRVSKEWKRGTPLEAATTIFQAEATDIAGTAYVSHDHSRVYHWFMRTITFYSSHQFLLRDGKQVKLDIPDDMELSTYDDQLLFKPRTAWEWKGVSYKAGSLVAIQVDGFFDTTGEAVCLFEPTQRSSLEGWSDTKNFIVLAMLVNVQSVQHYWKYVNGVWEDKGKTSEYGMNSVSVWAVDSDDSDDLWMSVSGYTQPSTLQLTTPMGTPTPLKALPAMYNADGLHVEQFQAASKDGTLIPYFMVSRKDLRLDGTTPTMLYGYGGFEISLTPSYSATVGAGWLEKGYVYVQANIRGGGEFGPSWHQAALKSKRHKAYEDFIAVGEDLVRRGVTSPAKLAVEGGSNGGLLVGNMLTRRPDLFGAIVCAVPLLDMQRYSKLLAGASWMGEFGDPEVPDEWAYIKTFSPFHNIEPAAKMQYPPTLFTTSTRDDRVHPAHARKMVKKLQDQGHTEVHYYENIEGGHGGAADNKQSAFMQTLKYSFLHKTL